MIDRDKASFPESHLAMCVGGVDDDDDGTRKKEGRKQLLRMILSRSLSLYLDITRGCR